MRSRSARRRLGGWAAVGCSTFSPGWGWCGSSKLPCSLAPSQAIAASASAPSASRSSATRPHVEAPLDSLGVGVQRADRSRPRGRASRAAPSRACRGTPRSRPRSPRGLQAVQVGAREQGVVVEHLLEVGHRPGGVDAVAGEAAADLVVDAAAGHRAQGLERHRRARRRSSRNSITEACGNLGAPPNPPLRASKVCAQLRDGGVERARVDRLGGGRQPRAAGQPLAQALAAGADLLAAARSRTRRSPAAPASRRACRGAARGGK